MNKRSQKESAAAIAAAEEDIRRRLGERAIAWESGFDFLGAWPTCRICGCFCPQSRWVLHAEWHANRSTLDYDALAQSIRARTEPLSVNLPPSRYVSAEGLNALADALERLGKVLTNG